MKRILFLDDDENRHKRFAQETTGCYVDHVHTVRECIEALEKNAPYDLVCLDHDLADPQETGSDVAEFIRLHLQRTHYPRNIIIHSWNPAGAKRMESMIKETGIPVLRKEFSC